MVFVPLSYCVHREDVARWSHLGVRDVAAKSATTRDFANICADKDSIA